MEKVVVITEMYENEEACTSIVRYDSVPSISRELIDKALLDDRNSISVEYNGEGTLQWLYSCTYRGETPNQSWEVAKWKDYFLEDPKEVNLLGAITIRTR